MPSPATIHADPENYRRLNEVKLFDECRTGVKGLVDAGDTAIPPIFRHPIETRPKPNSGKARPEITVPVIDISRPRAAVVDQIRHAASTLGFFQITNHGVPRSVINSLISSIRTFNELPDGDRMPYYSRDMSRGVAYYSNVDLYQSKAASWRDTLQMRLSPTPPEWDRVPVACREPAAEWDSEMVKLGEELMGLLCEGLGLEKDKMKKASCLDGRSMGAHYYPYCPQPDLTVGLTGHTDPGPLTMLVQNEAPGLQVKYGDDWIDVEPLPGAIVINIGDILQIMSNDEYKSVEHRVLANPIREPRVSAAVFFNPIMTENLYGPFPELVTAGRPAVYRQCTFAEYIGRYFSRGLDSKTLTNYYRIQ